MSLSLRISPEPLDHGGIEETQGPVRLKLGNCHFQNKDRHCGQRVSESGSSVRRNKKREGVLGRSRKWHLKLKFRF